jgi:hypothetical protein
MFFSNFPTTEYDFLLDGNSSKVPAISRNVSVVDKRFSNSIAYQYYEIYEKRPDQVSVELYGIPDYYWTFFVINDSLKTGLDGWPMRDVALKDYIANKYQNHTITLYREAETDFNYNSIEGKFPVGSILTGVESGATAVVLERKTKVNQLLIKFESQNYFNGTENIVADNGNLIRQKYEVRTYANSVAKYTDENSNEILNNENFYIPDNIVTYSEIESLKNDEKRKIRVLRSSVIRDFTVAFRRLLNE